MVSCKNQFYSALITPRPEHIDVLGTEFHVFYALKMREKHRVRYRQHLCTSDSVRAKLQHEELLVCYSGQWVALVK